MFALIVGLALGLLTSLPVKADTWIVTTVASYHPGGGDYNERNLGLGLEHGGEKFRIVGGGYRNSFYRDSYYIGMTAGMMKLGPVKIGLMAGGVTGYEDTVEPVLMPFMAIEGKQVGANLGIMPAKDGGVTVIGLQIKFRWK